MKSDPKLGALLSGHEKRDAIHIAIAPVVSGGLLRPGDRVGMVDGKAVFLERGAIGIVDPFMTKPVQPGERFYLLLLPYTITSLRHEWTHPAFALETSSPAANFSEQWLREFAERMEHDYDDIMKAAKEYLDFGRASVWGEPGFTVPSEFWSHYEAVTTRTVAPNVRDGEVYFSCSC